MMIEGDAARNVAFARHNGARFDTGPICGPIGPGARTTYGAAPFETALDVMKPR